MTVRDNVKAAAARPMLVPHSYSLRRTTAGGRPLAVMTGVIAGLSPSLESLRPAVMESVLFGVSPRDPLTLILVSLLLFVAALGAIWIPARRAAALGPLSSLRYE